MYSLLCYSKLVCSYIWGACLLCLILNHKHNESPLKLIHLGIFHLFSLMLYNKCDYCYRETSNLVHCKNIVKWTTRPKICSLITISLTKTFLCFLILLYGCDSPKRTSSYSSFVFESNYSRHVVYLFLHLALKDNQTFMTLFCHKLNCTSSQSIKTAKYDSFAVRLSTCTVWCLKKYCHRIQNTIQRFSETIQRSQWRSQ